MIKLTARLLCTAAMLAVPLGLAAGTAASASAAAPAAASAMVFGDGTGDAITDAGGHGSPVIMSAAGTIFTAVSAGGGEFQFRAPDGNCLTNNTGAANELWIESCSLSSAATKWTVNPTTHVVTSVQLAAMGVTGNMTAEDGCSTPAFVIDEGGVPLGCRNQLTYPTP